MSWFCLLAMDLLSRVVLDCANDGAPPPGRARKMNFRFSQVRAKWSSVALRDGTPGVEVALVSDVPVDTDSIREAFVAALTVPFADSARLDQPGKRVCVRFASGSLASAAAKAWADDVQREIETEEGQCG